MVWDNPALLSLLFFNAFVPVFKVRVVLKYRHCDGNLCIKVTDDSVVRATFSGWIDSLIDCLYFCYKGDVFNSCTFSVCYISVFAVQD